MGLGLRSRCLCEQIDGDRSPHLKSWAEATVVQLSGRSELAKAFRYMLGRWAALTRYLDDGRVAIDNNPAERALRGVAVARKNYLFAGSDKGAERAAALYSLIETCLCRARHSAVYAARRTMPNGVVFPRNGRDVDLIGSA